MTAPTSLTDYPAYTDLASQANSVRQLRVADLLAADPERATRYTASAAGLQLDYAKQQLDDSSLQSLLALAEQADLSARARALLAGEELNNTEARAALHSLLRASHSTDPRFAEVEATRAQMQGWTERIIGGQLLGYNGRPVTDVVNIGIGGSDLGPRLVTEALHPFQGLVTCHYVANVDPADLQETLLQLDPASTLFIICSKSFRTEETLTNGLAARQWLLMDGANESDLDKHFLAVTTNLAAAAEFGIPADNCLPLWDWVGGRYSVWSAVGLSCAIAVGWEHFSELLTGAEAMDAHFVSAPPAQNLPMLMSLLEIWNRNLLGAGSHAVLPYAQGLQKLPDFLQQLTMESNGKRVSSAGNPLPYQTAPVLWGSAGTMGQHSFHQLLHQGTQDCPADFVLPLTTHTGMSAQHQRLVANCLAQSRAMMVGRSEAEALDALAARGVALAEAERLAPHLMMPGNRPNSIITMDSLTPATLGALLALYEHRTFCSGQLWGINSFDQWGVELGKEIGAEILGELSIDGAGVGMDASTIRLMAAWRAARDSV